jgi:hypothetical protein
MLGEFMSDLTSYKTYKPARSAEGLNPHVVSGALKWLVSTVIFCALAVACLWYFPELSPDDPDLLLRWLTDRYVRVVFLLGVATGFTLFMEWYTNGNLIGRILQDARSSAIALVGMFIAITLLLIGG